MTYIDDSTTITEINNDDDKMLILNGAQRLSYFEGHEENQNTGKAKPASRIFRLLKKSFSK